LQEIAAVAQPTAAHSAAAAKHRMQNMTQLIHAMLHAALKLPTLEAATILAEAAVVAAGHDRHVARLLAEVASFTVDGALLQPPNSNNYFDAFMRQPTAATTSHAGTQGMDQR
jgi:hypothetical protein